MSTNLVHVIFYFQFFHLFSFGLILLFFQLIWKSHIVLVWGCSFCFLYFEDSYFINYLNNNV